MHEEVRKQGFSTQLPPPPTAPGGVLEILRELGKQT